MQTPFYIHPIDATPEQRSQFIQDVYPDAKCSTKEITEALDEVSQLYHRLGSIYDGPQPMVKLSEAGQLALSMEWLVATSVGYEPTVEGLLVVDGLREQSGYSLRFEHWDEVIEQEIAAPSNLVPADSIPTYYVLKWLQRWERQGVTNTTLIRDDYCYCLLAKTDYFERSPSVRFLQAFVTSLLQRELVVERSGGLYLTTGGEAFLSEMDHTISEELREAEERHDVNLSGQSLRRKESSAMHFTVCAAGPAHEPEDTNGTEDGFTDCIGCGNVLWAGYAEDEQPNPANK